MDATQNPKTPRFTAISPYLFYPDGDAAVAWLIRTFGFGPSRRVTDAGGRWQEGEIDVGSAVVSISAGQTPDAESGRCATLIVSVDDVDALHAQVEATGHPIDPVRQETYGPRTCHATDPWGYRWYFWEGAAHFPPEQMPD